MMNKLNPTKEAVTREEDFLIILFRMFHNVRIYQNNNCMVKESINQFREAVLSYLVREFEFLISDGRFVLQGLEFRYRKELARVVRGVLDFFADRGLKGFVIRSSFKDISPTEIQSFVRVLICSVDHEDSFAWLEQSINRQGFSWIQIVPAEQAKPKKSPYDPRQKARTTYWHAQGAVKEIARKLPLQGQAGVRKVKRVVQNMVDQVCEDESIILTASTIRDHDDYTYTHSVNVAILSMCLGNRIGLSRASLTYLGICGLLHDLGKVEVSQDILRKPEELDGDEWEEMRKHPMSGVRQVLKLGASHALKSRVLLAPYEHHLHNDLSGYPKTRFVKQVSLFGKILQITDFYDAITSSRAYRQYAFIPHQALKILLEKSGEDFDPILAKVFVTMMGTYPVGSLLQLDTGEIGLVMDYPSLDKTALPRILLLVDQGQGGLEPGEVVRLHEKDPEKGSFVRKVTGCLHPENYGIQPAHFLF
jgi:HD-GYP domain-containing protein (c-di-GMP phosphodiesterase class II)